MSASDVPRELELKIVVDDAAALARVTSAAERRGARAAAPLVQRNHLFDTPSGALLAAGFVLRLREQQDGHRRAFTLTAKGRLAEAGDGALHARAEEEAAVAADVAGRVLAGVESLLERLADALGRRSALVEEVRRRLADAGEPLVEIGAFTNERTVVGPLVAPSVDSGTTVALELDRTSLPDGTESYEVELELPAEAVESGRALLAEILAEAGVPWRPAGSKSSRFAESLERLARRDAEG